jgi:hypothetical protein
MAVSHVESRTGPVAPEIFTLAAMKSFVADATPLSRLIAPLAAMQSGNLARMGNIAVMDHTSTKW